MAIQPAYKAQLSIVGQELNFLLAPVSRVAGNIWQIATGDWSIKSVSSLDVQSGGAVQRTFSLADFTFFNLSSQLRDDNNLLSGVSGGDIFASGVRFTKMNLLGATSYTLNLSAELQDKTSFDSAASNNGYRSREAALLDVSGSVSGIATTGSFGNLNSLNALRLRQLPFLQFDFANKFSMRGRFAFESVGVSGDVSSLEGLELSFQGSHDRQNEVEWENRP